MSYGSGDLRKLASKKRKRSNLEEVKSVLEEMESEVKDPIANWLEAVEEVREALTKLLDKQEEMDADLIGSEGVEKIASACEGLEAILPEEDSSISEFSDHFDNAVSSADSLESQLDDTSCTADEREETWGEITDYLTNMADALDELAMVGVEVAEPEEDGPEEDDE